MSQPTARRAGRTIKKKKQGISTPLIIGGIVGAVALLGLVLFLLRQQSTGSIPGLETFDDQGASLHIANVTDPHPPYNSNPPTSEYHVGNQATSPGIYTQPIPDQITVHSLEHGMILIHYRQDVAPEVVTQITDLARQLQQRNPCVVVLPREVDKLDTPIAMAAWNNLIRLQTVDAPVMTQFFETFVGRGPERVCTPTLR